MIHFRFSKTLLSSGLLAVCGLSASLSAHAQLLPIQNADFESLGSAQFAPNIFSLKGWTFFGDHPATAGGLKPGSNFGYNDPTAVLYLATDWVGFSNYGGVYQNIGTTIPGDTYTFTGTVYGETINPSSYRISLRDASTNQQLAAITQQNFNPAHFGALTVSFSYHETAARILRLQLETTGVVVAGKGFRTAVDNVSVRQQAAAVPEPGALALLFGGALSGFLRLLRCPNRACRSARMTA